MRKKVLFSIISMFVLALSCIGCKASTETGNTPLTDNKQEHAKELPTIVPERGIIEDGTYINKTFGVGFKISENAYVYTDEQIYQVLSPQYSFFEDCEEELADGVFTVSEMEQVFKGNIHDVIIVDDTTTISILYENMDIVFGERYSLQEYVDSLKALIQQQDPECFIFPATRATLGGEDYSTFEVKYSDDTRTDFYAKIKGNYIVSIGFSSNGTLKEEKAFTDAFLKLQE